MQEHTFMSYLSLRELIASYDCDKSVLFHPKYFDVIVK